MLKRLLMLGLFALLSCGMSFGQMKVGGLMPGRSTKAEVGRVLGQPFKQVSETLVEYKPLALTGKIFVQYRAGSDLVERIEILCRLPNSTCKDFATKWGLQLPADPEAVKAGADGKLVNYYGGPQYIVTTVDPSDTCAECANVPFRIAFYSRELYAVTAAPALQEMGVEGVDTTDPGYEELKGVVKLRAPDGSLKPFAGASVTFCWPPQCLVRYSSTKTDGQGMFTGTLLKGTYVAVVTGPGLKWTYREGLKIPSASALEFVVEPGDGASPTTRDVENAIRKN